MKKHPQIKQADWRRLIAEAGAQPKKHKEKTSLLVDYTWPRRSHGGSEYAHICVGTITE